MNQIDPSRVKWDDDMPAASHPGVAPSAGSWLSDFGRQLGLSGRAGVTGAMALPNMVGDAANSLINLGIKGVNTGIRAVAPMTLSDTVSGDSRFQIPELQLPSHATQELMSKAGLPAPKNATERVVQDVAGAVSGAGGMMSAAGAASKVIGNGVAKVVAGQMAQAPVMQAVSAAAAGGAGGAERERGGGVGKQVAASLIAGLLPAGAMAAGQAVKAVARPLAPAMNKAAMENAAAERFQKMSGEPDTLALRLHQEMPADPAMVPGEIVPGSAPTTAQMLGDKSLLAAERGRRSGRAEFAQQFDDRLGEQTAARLGAMDDISPVGKPLNAASQDAGAVIAAEAKKGRAASIADTDAAYSDGHVQSINVPIKGDAIDAVMQKYYGNLGDLAPGPLKTLARAIMGQEGTVPFKDFQVMRHLASKMAVGMRDSDPTAAAAAREITSTLDAIPELLAKQTTTKLAQTGAGQHGPVFGGLSGDPENAVAHLMRQRTGEVPGALSHPQIKDPIDLLWGRAPADGVDGYGLAKIAAKHPEALPDIQEFLQSMQVNAGQSGPNRVRLSDDAARRAVVRNDWEGEAKTWLMTAFEKQNPAAGGVSSGPSKRTDTAGLVREGDTALSATAPNVGEMPPYVNMVSPQQAAALKAAQAARTDQAAKWDTGAMGKVFKYGSDGVQQIVGGEVPPAFFNNSRTSLQDIRQFMKAVGNKPDAVEALKNYAITGLHERAYNPTTGNLMPDRFQKWVSSHGQALDALLGQEHAGRLRLIADDLLRANRSNSALKAPGSDTAQNLAQGMGQGLMSKIPGGGLVLSTGRVIVNAVKSMSESQINDVIDRALLDPKFAQVLLAKVTPSNKDILLNRFYAGMQGTAEGSAAVQEQY